MGSRMERTIGGYLLTTLLNRYGPQGWWPAESRLEMAVGAILVQNTNWRNAARAIDELRRRDLLDAITIVEHPAGEIEEALRPSGFFRQKAARIKRFCRWLILEGGFDALNSRDTWELRRSMLGLNGVGPETADCILLYALQRPLFVADAYARRILGRTGFVARASVSDYELTRQAIESQANLDADAFNELHALLVEHGKRACKKHEPLCDQCVLAPRCHHHLSGARVAATTGHRN